MLVKPSNVLVGGLSCSVYQRPSEESSRPVAVLFFLHGRYGSALKLDPIIQDLFNFGSAHDSDNGSPALDLIVVAFDHRNHGSRLVDKMANEGWSTEKERHNPRHAVDMYAIQTGTARDVSCLIDFLPSFLFPLNERKISSWGIAGLSLGGHSTWIALSREARLQFGVPIIACPDYLPLMKDRAKGYNIPFAAPYFPSTLLDMIHSNDPVSTPYTSYDTTNPFFGKKILVLSGADDTLVPWKFSQAFVEALEVGSEGHKRFQVMADTGHECSPQMIAEMAQFLNTVILS